MNKCEKKLTISVIIPVFNGEKWLSRCFQSLKEQTIYDNLEVIFIDDGSNDSSGEIIDEFALNNSNVIVKHKLNSGVSSARNIGLDLAKAEIISFIDVDDFLDNNFFERLYNEFDNDIDIVCCGFAAEYKNNTVKRTACKDIVIARDKIIDAFLLEKELDPNITDKLFRKSIIGDLRFDSNYAIAEDRWFLFQCLDNVNKIKIIAEAKYHYVMNDESACRQSFSKKKFDSLIVADKILQVIREKYPEHIDIAESSQMDMKCRVLGELFGFGAKEQYKIEYNKLKKDIRRYSFWKKCKFSSKKHSIAFLAAKISPSLYTFLKNDLKGQYRS